MAKEYDKIFRENFEEIVRNTSDLILNLHFKVVNGIGTNEFPKTIERSIDFAKIVEDDSGFRFVLQLEFQTKDDDKMVIRMLVYKALIQDRLRLPIRQFVIYLGEKESQMKTRLKDYISGEDAEFGYKLIELRKFPIKQMLDSDVPEEILLAVLGDFGEKDKIEVVKAIIDRLKSVCDDKRKLSKYVFQLRILSNLRNLDKVVLETLKTMPLELEIKIEEDAFYKEGEQKGELRMQYELAERLIIRGKDTVLEISEVTGLAVDEVEKLKSQIERKSRT